MPFMTVDQFSTRTGMKPSTVRAWILRRRISVVRFGRSVRISEDELSRLIREGTTPARGESRVA
jgi:excisionase family DNA binding protein